MKPQPHDSLGPSLQQRTLGLWRYHPGQDGDAVQEQYGRWGRLVRRHGIAIFLVLMFLLPAIMAVLAVALRIQRFGRLAFIVAPSLVLAIVVGWRR